MSARTVIIGWLVLLLGGCYTHGIVIITKDEFILAESFHELDLQQYNRQNCWLWVFIYNHENLILGVSVHNDDSTCHCGQFVSSDSVCKHELDS